MSTQEEGLFHLFHGFFDVAPEGRTVVRVVGNKTAGGFCKGEGVLCGAAGRLIGQGQRAKVENFTLPDQVFGNFLRGQRQICAEIAAEAEFPVAVLVQSDEGKGGIAERVGPEPPVGDAALDQGFPERFSEEVVAYLPDKGGAAVVAGDGGEKVHRRSSRFWQRGVAVWIVPAGEKS